MQKEYPYDPTISISVRRPSAFETEGPPATKNKVPFRGSSWRFIVLGLISIVSLGASFSTSSTLAVQYELNYISLLSYVPYVFFPLFGGAIVDKYGVRSSLAVFGVSVTFGSMLLTGDEKVAIIGAVFLIIGSGCLLVAQATIASKWFRNRELALAIGSYLCVSKIASLLGNVILSSNYTGDLYNTDDAYDYDDDDKDSDLSDYISMHSTQQTVFNVGVGLSIVSLVGILILIFVDQRADADEEDSALCQNQGVQQNPETGTTGLNNYRLVFYLLASCFLIQGVFLGFDRAFFNYLVNSQEYVSYQINAIESYTSVGIIIALLFPVFGFHVDRFGKKTTYLMVSSIIFTIICIIAIIIMANNSEIEEIAIQILYIFVDAIFQPIFLCVFWFCIPLVFDQKMMGIGAGIAVSITNIMAFASSGAYYFVLDDYDSDDSDEDVDYDNWLDFTYYLVLVGIIAFFGTIFSIWLHKEDARNGGKLTNPSVMTMAKNSSIFASNSAFL